MNNTTLKNFASIDWKYWRIMNWFERTDNKRRPTQNKTNNSFNNLLYFQLWRMPQRKCCKFNARIYVICIMYFTLTVWIFSCKIVSMKSINKLCHHRIQAKAYIFQFSVFWRMQYEGENLFVVWCKDFSVVRKLVSGGVFCYAKSYTFRLGSEILNLTIHKFKNYELLAIKVIFVWIDAWNTFEWIQTKPKWDRTFRICDSWPTQTTNFDWKNQYSVQFWHWLCRL